MKRQCGLQLGGVTVNGGKEECTGSGGYLRYGKYLWQEELCIVELNTPMDTGSDCSVRFLERKYVGMCVCLTRTPFLPGLSNDEYGHTSGDGGNGKWVTRNTSTFFNLFEPLSAYLAKKSKAQFGQRLPTLGRPERVGGDVLGSLRKRPWLPRSSERLERQFPSENKGMRCIKVRPEECRDLVHGDDKESLQRGLGEVHLDTYSIPYMVHVVPVSSHLVHFMKYVYSVSPMANDLVGMLSRDARMLPKPSGLGQVPGACSHLYTHHVARMRVMKILTYFIQF
ncbi:hypothetical protein PM082_000319 [Marasmius tenuissimus]|nr:hypothetical protein PM082_000319 [Marasmius tenuissimus]